MGCLPLSLPPLDCPLVDVLCCVTSIPCASSQAAWLLAAAFGPALAVGLLALGPAVSQIVFSRPPQRSLKFGPSMAMTISGPAVEAAQTLAWPTLVGPCPRSPQLLKLDLSQLRGHLSVPVSCRL